MLHVSASWVSQNLSAHDQHWRVASSQELLRSYTCDKELFCRRLDTGDKLWIYLWDPLSKLKFMQWKDVDRPTIRFTQICRPILSHYLARLCQQFSWDTDGLLMANYLHPGKTTIGQYSAKPTFKLLDVIKQKHRRKLPLWSVTFSRQCTSAQVIGCSASSLRV